jgi:hypothetical protein
MGGGTRAFGRIARTRKQQQTTQVKPQWPVANARSKSGVRTRNENGVARLFFAKKWHLFVKTEAPAEHGPRLLYTTPR